MAELELEAEKLISLTGGNWENTETSARRVAEFAVKYYEKQRLEFAIEQLNKLYTTLQEKYRILISLHKENVGKMREQHLRNKKAGISVAKEEIRRNIKELEQQLNDL